MNCRFRLHGATKKAFLLISFCIVGLCSSSQSNIRINNYWENTYYINPASVFSEYRNVISGAVRQQWVTFPGAPATGYLTMVRKFSTRKNTQIGNIGLKILSDRIGFTSLINIAPSFAYSVRLNQSLLMNLGLAYKVQRFSYDMTKADTEIIGDPATYSFEASWGTHNADIGIELIERSFLAGASIQNLASLFNSTNKLQTNSSFLYFMYRRRLDSYFNMRTGISAIKNDNLYQVELYAASSFSPNYRRDLFQVGFFYRTMREVGLTLGLDIGTSARLAYSYDYHFGGIRYHSLGTHEMMLTWKFEKVMNCNCWELFK